MFLGSLLPKYASYWEGLGKHRHTLAKLGDNSNSQLNHNLENIFFFFLFDLLCCLHFLQLGLCQKIISLKVSQGNLSMEQNVKFLESSSFTFGKSKMTPDGTEKAYAPK